MTTYVDITKPSNTSYTNENAVGKQQYDQATLMYDDPGVFYDSVNESLYTDISKPSSTTYVDISKPI